VTLLLAITAAAWCLLGTGFGVLAGHSIARHRYEQQLEHIAQLNHAYYEQPAYGDD
jgi:hypothetical protein